MKHAKGLLILTLSSGFIALSAAEEDYVKHSINTFSDQQVASAIMKERFDASSRARSCSPVCEAQSDGVGLLHEVFGLISAEQEQRARFDKLNMAQQKLIIQTAEQKKFKNVLELASSWYAEFLTHDRVFQLLLEHNTYGKRLLDFGPLAAFHIVDFLYKNHKNELMPLVPLVPATIHRCFAISSHKLNRADAFVAHCPASSEVISIQTDMKGPEDDVCGVIKTPVIPTLIRQLPSCYGVPFDKDELMNNILDHGQLFRYIRTYQMSPDGSYLLAFAMDDHHELKKIFMFERNKRQNFVCTKKLFLNTGICASKSVCRNRYKYEAHVFNYDIQKTFAINPMERTAAFVDTMHDINTVDLSTGIISRVLGNGKYLYVSYSPTGTMLAAVTSDNTICLWSIIGHTCLHDIMCPGPISHVTWTPDSKQLIMAVGKGISIFSLENRSFKNFNTIHQHEITHMCINHPGTLLLSADFNGDLCLWNLNSSEVLAKHYLSDVEVISLELSPHGDYAFITCNRNGAIIIAVWDTHRDVFVYYEDIDTNIFSNLSQAMVHDSLQTELKNLSLPHMMLLLASGWAKRESNKYAIRPNHYFASHYITLPLWLKKIVAEHIILLSD